MSDTTAGMKTKTPTNGRSFHLWPSTRNRNGHSRWSRAIGLLVRTHSRGLQNTKANYTRGLLQPCAAH